MSISISKPPQSVFPVYVAQVVEFTASGSEESVTITVGIDGQGEMTFVRDFYNTKVKFNLAGVVSSALDAYKGKTMLNVVENALDARVPSWADAFLSASGWVQVASDEATRVHFTAVNASLPVGRPTSEFVTEGRCLTKFPSIKLYEGYREATELCFQVPSNVGSGAKVIFSNGVNGGFSVEVTGEHIGPTEGAYLWLEVYIDGTPYYDVIDFDSLSSQEEAAQHMADYISDGVFRTEKNYFRPYEEVSNVIQNVTHEGNVVKFYAGSLGAITDVKMSIVFYSQGQDPYDPEVWPLNMIVPVISEFSDIPESIVTEGAGRVVGLTIPEGDIPGVALSVNGSQEDLLPLTPSECLSGQFIYVRWVNSLAGYDYWMFEGRQTLKRAISEQKVFKPYLEENDQTYRYPITVSQLVSDTIVAGSEGVSASDFEVLREITTSPLVQIYTQEGWLTVYVKATSVDSDNSQPRKDVEFEFALPPLNLQF